MKTVITYGTYDLLHVGHINLLRRASELGDRLVVGISSDEFNLLKGKSSIFSFKERKQILEAVRYVDEVFAEDNWEQKRDDIKKYDADIFVMGSDWMGKFDDLADICEVRYLARTEEISTTYLKNKVVYKTKEDGTITVSVKQ